MAARRDTRAKSAVEESARSSIVRSSGRWSARFVAAALAARLILATNLGAAAGEPAPIALRKVGEYHLLTARYGAAAVAKGEAIYIIGGARYEAVTDIERFDTRTHRIERAAIGLLPRRFHRAVEFDGRIFILGGESYAMPSETIGREAAVEIFDLATGTISRGAPMPNPRHNPAVVRIGDKVIVAGGAQIKDGHLSHTNETDIYDLAANRWLKGVPMPTPREAPAVLVGGFVMIAGGYRGRSRVDNVEMFVPQENVWKTLPPLARKVSAHSAAVLGKYLLLFGDYDDFDRVFAYDLSARRTLPVRANYSGGRHSTAVTIGSVAYVIGGAAGAAGEAIDTIQAFSL